MYIIWVKILNAHEIGTLVNPREVPNSMDEEKVCDLCCKKLEIASVGECDHPICYECSTRMRKLCEKNECPMCRKDLDHVILTENVRPYSEMKGRMKHYASYMSLNMFFENDRVEKAFRKLIEISCHKCSKVFSNFDDLKEHMRLQHYLRFCKLCTENLKIFPRDFRTYTAEQLKKHMRSGDSRNASHKGHPLCKYCGQHFMDVDALFHHCKIEHIYCQLCQINGMHNFFGNQELLRDHYREKHFLCELESCGFPGMAMVFLSDSELQSHKRVFHGKRIGLRPRPDDIGFQFNYSRNAANRANVGGNNSNQSGGSARPPSANQAQINLANFEEQFPSLGANAARPRWLDTLPAYVSTSGNPTTSRLALNPQNFPSLGNQPGTSANQPGTSANQPRTTANQPRTSANQPGTSANQPGTSAKHPGTSRVEAKWKSALTKPTPPPPKTPAVNNPNRDSNALNESNFPSLTSSDEQATPSCEWGKSNRNTQASAQARAQPSASERFKANFTTFKVPNRKNSSRTNNGAVAPKASEASKSFVIPNKSKLSSSQNDVGSSPKKNLKSEGKNNVGGAKGGKKSKKNKNSGGKLHEANDGKDEGCVASKKKDSKVEADDANLNSCKIDDTNSKSKESGGSSSCKIDDKNTSFRKIDDKNSKSLETGCSTSCKIDDKKSKSLKINDGNICSRKTDDQNSISKKSGSDSSCKIDDKNKDSRKTSDKKDDSPATDDRNAVSNETDSRNAASRKADDQNLRSMKAGSSGSRKIDDQNERVNSRKTDDKNTVSRKTDDRNEDSRKRDERNADFRKKDDQNSRSMKIASNSSCKIDDRNVYSGKIDDKTLSIKKNENKTSKFSKAGSSFSIEDENSNSYEIDDRNSNFGEIEDNDSTSCKIDDKLVRGKTDVAPKTDSKFHIKERKMYENGLPQRERKYARNFQEQEKRTRNYPENRENISERNQKYYNKRNLTKTDAKAEDYAPYSENYRPERYPTEKSYNNRKNTTDRAQTGFRNWREENSSEDKSYFDRKENYNDQKKR